MYFFPFKALIGGTNASITHSHDTYRNRTHITFQFFITQHNATCSSAGSYDVIFQNETENVLHTASVTFTIKRKDTKVKAYMNFIYFF